MSDVRIVYACTTDRCEERLRGTTDEPGLWCSICLRDLTPIALDEGVEPVDIIRLDPRR